VALVNHAFLKGLAYFKSKNKCDDDFNSISFLSFAMLPSPFPQKEFEYAYDLQLEWNKLLDRCSNDHTFLFESLQRYRN